MRLVNSVGIDFIEFGSGAGHNLTVGSSSITIAETDWKTLMPIVVGSSAGRQSGAHAELWVTNGGALTFRGAAFLPYSSTSTSLSLSLQVLPNPFPPPADPPLDSIHC